MYAQLGNIRFEGLKGFSSFEESFGVNYAQHDLINGKPRLEAVGDVLDTISFDMFLHADFTDPESDIDALRLAMKNREILTLVLGNGKIVGNFVIPSFKKSTSFTDPAGNIIQATLSIELLESIDHDPIKSAKKRAIEKGFATSQRNSNVRSVLAPKLSPGSVITHDIGKIESHSIKVTQYTSAVTKEPATAELYSDKINESLDSMTESINEVNSKLSESQDLMDLAVSLPSALASVNSRIQDIKAILPITDIESFKTFNQRLNQSVLVAKKANMNLSNQSVIRRI